MGDYLKSQGIQLVYHHHLGTVIESQADVERLMDNTGEGVGLLLDFGHLRGAGGDPLAIAKRYSQRIHHVHCKDLRFPVLDTVRNRDKSFLNGVLDGLFTVPGGRRCGFSARLNPSVRTGLPGLVSG
ncbi:hypothetical protein HSBAA_60530 [Vreelandella sulfidaeris]|uniref:Xylose isomerase-like TIM barrel domain-containing protein n=1 Tax=Vreelandella sulfidaeris TaxID=115553 RepID=A0A455UGB6_9GAMM|nr:hypothetical protein HSBAA_60530 [Halomonas sulfidaeris]